jgi:hypothetical protein
MTMDDTWIYQYNPEIKQQPMEWRHSSSPCSKYSECKNPLENISPRNFWGIKTTSSSLYTFQRLNYKCRVLPFSAGVTEGHFEGIMTRKFDEWCLVLGRKCPGSPATCNTEETGLHGLPMSWSPVLLSRIGTVEIPHFPIQKKQLKDQNFSSNTEVIAAAETWLNGQYSDLFKRLAEVNATY